MIGFDGIHTLTIGTTIVDLSNSIMWVDEYNWHPVTRQVNYTLTGALIITTSKKLAGRPITLESSSDAAWLPRSSVDQLKMWADDPAAMLVLKIRGITYSVIFAPDSPLEATPVIPFSDPIATDWYQVKLKLIEATL